MASRFTLGLAATFALAALTAQASAVEAIAATAVRQAALQKAALSTDAVVRAPVFLHRLFRPEHPSGRVIILMHGSGGDETTLVSLALKIAPDATLIGIRGRVVQDGVQRWYKRVTATEFDQQDIRAEATALADFLSGIAKEYGIDLASATFLGYSNGANLIAALTQLHPGLIHSAVLLRSMPVLAETAQVDLSGARFLTISGEKDKLYYPFAPKLESLLRNCGAQVEARIIPFGHGIGDEDARIVAAWLDEGASTIGNATASATKSPHFVLSSQTVTRTEKGEER